MKKTKLFTAAAIMAMVLAMTGCSQSSAAFDIENEKEGNAVFENAAVGTELSSGAFVIKEDEQLIIEPKLEKGEVLVQMQRSEGETEENPVKFDNPDLEVKVSGTEKQICSLEAGEYNVKLSVQDKATGSIRFYVEAGKTEETGEIGGHLNWTNTDSAEEAAKGAGLDSFKDLNGTVLYLGEIGTMGDITYRYATDIVQALFSVSAVDMSVVKAKSYVAEGDVSLDNEKYTYEWTQNVDGQEVKCYGNKEGASTKTIWITGDYAYGIAAQGVGGEDDFGLNEDDVAVMVNAMIK